MMLAIIDSRAPKEAILNLEKHVDAVFQFGSSGITFNSISCHPDIFIYQDAFNLILAPNAPDALVEFLTSHKVHYVFGKNNVEASLRSSVAYNCLATSDYLFHKSGFTDPSISSVNQEKDFINLRQAYTRCSLTHIGNNYYITSDKGIEKKLVENGLDCFYFSPEQISIMGHKHGFLGGTNGRCKDKLFFMGNIDLHKDGKELRNFIEEGGIEIVSLTEGFLYDGGGIFFIEVDISLMI